jgi:hypothetical protein
MIERLAADKISLGWPAVLIAGTIRFLFWWTAH